MVPMWSHAEYVWVPSHQLPAIANCFWPGAYSHMLSRPIALQGGSSAAAVSKKSNLNRRKITNMKLQRPTRHMRAGTWKLQNAKLPRPSLLRTFTWDKSPLHEDPIREQLVIFASAWKSSEATDDSTAVATSVFSEEDAQATSDAMTSRQQQNEEALLTASFNGKWSKAQIYNGVLTWVEGEDVPIEVLSDLSFQMCYLGTICSASLQEDGNLHWDDGDVWCRSKAEFEGFWGQARIKGNILKWDEGEETKIFPLSATSFQMRYFINVAPYSERMYHAEIQNDGQLHWDDGDVWSRGLPPWRRGLHEVKKPTEKASCPAVLARPRTPSRARNDVAECFASTQCSREPRVAVAVNRAEEPTEKTSFADIAARRGNLSPARKVLTERLPPGKSSEQENVAADSMSRGHGAAVVLKPTDRKWYQGVVKWFRGSYGWIVCEQAVKGKDIMVHKNDCDFKPKQGDEICFQFMTNGQGDAQALKAKRPPSTIDAKDWFRARANERSKPLSRK